MVGAVILNPRITRLDITPAVRAEATFDGCAGSGQITGTELFGAGDKPLAYADTARLLEAVLPSGNGGEAPIGKLLNGALLTLLDARHAGWADEEGCGGCIELLWDDLGNGTAGTQIGSHIGYRSLVIRNDKF